MLNYSGSFYVKLAVKKALISTFPTKNRTQSSAFHHHHQINNKKKHWTVRCAKVRK